MVTKKTLRLKISGGAQLRAQNTGKRTRPAYALLNKLRINIEGADNLIVAVPHMVSDVDG